MTNGHEQAGTIKLAGRTKDMTPEYLCRKRPVFRGQKWEEVKGN